MRSAATTPGASRASTPRRRANADRITNSPARGRSPVASGKPAVFWDYTKSVAPPVAKILEQICV